MKDFFSPQIPLQMFIHISISVCNYALGTIGIYVEVCKYRLTHINNIIYIKVYIKTLCLNCYDSSLKKNKTMKMMWSCCNIFSLTKMTSDLLKP